ncbi:MAG: 2-dehydro-3-deoxy-6-phosphogalactonate aldolase [Colwellia sp.]|nr:2-dehydro-3-deoxy-6-phosphogalactonate aldolase [Colwellia sp.]
MAMPLIAILRGVRPDEVIAVTESLIAEGFTMVEVPLNSPDALKSIQLLSEKFGEQVLIGAGTVLNIKQVQQVANAGGKLIVSPNANIGVIEKTKNLGMISIPGVATPTELFSAIDAGADGVKAFPAEMLPENAIKSWRAVMPSDFPIFAVGGVNINNMAAYKSAGVDGFGLGSNLYRSGKRLSEIRVDAQAFIHAAKEFI